MALTKSQIAVLQLLALQRRDESSYFAGGAALNQLDFVESVPSAHDLSLLWKNAVVSAKVLIDLLPEEHLGECLLDKNGQVYTGNTGQLRQDITAGNIHFHKGTLRGVWPEMLK